MFGDEFLAQGLHLKSQQRCSAVVRTCLSVDQSSNNTGKKVKYALFQAAVYKKN